MHDLRRRALESSKTVSRRALSKQSSPATSRSNSRAPSRVASTAVSRAGSDDEDTGGELSDETSFRYVLFLMQLDCLRLQSQHFRTDKCKTPS